MESIIISDPNDRSFPFSRKIFEDHRVLYHGTWSTWCSRIETEGFIPSALPFDWQHVATVFRANQAIGRGSYLRVFLGDKYPYESPPFRLYFSANFWFARAYATDNGGEVIRKTLEEAGEFEDICANPQRLASLKNGFVNALREHGPHPLTQTVIKTIENENAINQLRAEVRAAKDALTYQTAHGHPIVYAVRVEPEWLGDYWDSHISSWEEGEREVNLPCCGCTIAPDRLIAKASYPNGTDPDFMPTWCSTWEDVVDLSSRTDEEFGSGPDIPGDTLKAPKTQ